MPQDATEGVAEHSSRLQPSINVHAPVTAFMFSCSGTMCTMHDTSMWSCMCTMHDTSMLPCMCTMHDTFMWLCICTMHDTSMWPCISTMYDTSMSPCMCTMHDTSMWSGLACVHSVYQVVTLNMNGRVLVRQLISISFVCFFNLYFMLTSNICQMMIKAVTYLFTYLVVNKPEWAIFEDMWRDLIWGKRLTLA